MRFLILIALCISSTFAYDLKSVSNFYFSSTKISDAHLNSVGPTLRLKRDLYQYPLEDPNKCIENCSKATEKRLKKINLSPYSFKINAEDDKTGQKFCKVTESLKDCITACPNSLLRNLMQDVVPLPLGLCSLGYNLSDVQVNLDCINASMAAVEEKCDPDCHTYIDYSIHGEVHVSPSYIKYNDNKTQNTVGFQTWCKNTKCTMTCGESILRSKCGQKAFDLEKKYVWSLIGYVFKLYQDMNALDRDVNECQTNS